MSFGEKDSSALVRFVLEWHDRFSKESLDDRVVSQNLVHENSTSVSAAILNFMELIGAYLRDMAFCPSSLYNFPEQIILIQLYIELKVPPF